MRDLGLQLEQEIRVEIVIFGLEQFVAREPADRLEIVPQGEHLDVDHVVLLPVQAPSRDIPFG